MGNENEHTPGTEDSILDLGDTTRTPVECRKLTASEFREYNRLAEHMDSFVGDFPCLQISELNMLRSNTILEGQHNHFRVTWNKLYATASETTGRDLNPRLSPSQFLRAASRFLDTLTMHHSIEETYIFPRLASRMPAFQQNLTLINQHKQIHTGMDRLQVYLADCRKGVRDLRMSEVKELMDPWRDVLWAHLDNEVEELGAEKMRQYWSLQEIKSFGF